MNILQKKINEIYLKEHIEVLEYSKMKAPAKVRCKKCGSVYELKRAEGFVKKGKKCICKKCVNNGSGGRLSLNDFQDKINKLYPQESLKVLSYILKDKPCSIQCEKCGNIYTLQNAESFCLKGKKRICLKCFPNKREQIEKTYKKFLNFIDGSEDFIYMDSFNQKFNSNTLFKCKCTQCGKINNKTMYDYLNGKGCSCQAKNILMTQEEYQEYLGDEYSALSKYKGKAHRILIRHNLCGFCYSTNARYYHCPKCSGSKGEKTIRFILEQENIEYLSEYKVNIQDHDLRFDFYLPKYNMFIEYQGEQHFKPIPYFGGEKSFKKQQEYDNLKRKWIKEKSCHLLEIKYNENIKDKIFNYLLKFNDHPERE